MIQRPPLLVSIVGSFVAAAGCADVTYFTRIVDSPRPLVPRLSAEVEVYVVTPPDRPHQAIGFIQVFLGGQAFDSARMVGELRERAGQIGCDALLITSVDRRQSRHTHSPSESIEGSCVVYTDVEPRGVAVPSAAPLPPPVAVLVASGAIELRTAPSPVAPVLAHLLPGGRVTVGPPAGPGWCFVRLADGRGGYVQDGALRRE